jgi:hypoxanthine phosphoribosyltransferase
LSAKLKGVIFGVQDILLQDQESKPNQSTEICKLLCYIVSKGLTPIVLANNEREDLEAELKRICPNLCWFTGSQSTFYKPKARAVEYVLEQMGWTNNEVIYVGSAKSDMLTAINGNVMFLNATWYGRSVEVGFEFTSPMEVGKYIDTFCLRDHSWFYCIEDSGLRYYSLAPFSTWKDTFRAYSQSAKDTMKDGLGKPDFWAKYLTSAVYFSGMANEINYICPYPGHSPDSRQIALEEALISFSKAIRKKYIGDLLVRHTKALKSQAVRNQRKQVHQSTQLNTIHVNKKPIKNGAVRYATSPLAEGKTVLVIDDFCTEGYSLEAARVYLQQTGAKVICLSLLKTINTSYNQILDIDKFDPYKPNSSLQIISTQQRPYQDHIINNETPQELTNKLSAYDNWQWPND